MFPVVISTAPGEREAEFMLSKAWEMLGGTVLPGICAYVENNVDFEANKQYKIMIEKKAEDIYRAVTQKTVIFPTSINLGNGSQAGFAAMDLTPQEGEQLSEYVSNDNFVKKQKEDVEELSQLYRSFLEKGKEDDSSEFVKEFKAAFHAPEDDFNAVYYIKMTDLGKNLVLDVSGKVLKCYYGDTDNADVTATTTRETVNTITKGRATLQGGFMSSKITCKGDFKLLRTFDQIFRFGS